MSDFFLSKNKFYVMNHLGNHIYYNTTTERYLKKPRFVQLLGMFRPKIKGEFRYFVKDFIILNVFCSFRIAIWSN